MPNKLKNISKILLVFTFLSTLVSAQPVTLTPAIVTQNDTVTITFDATQGNAALVGVAPVYMHTGVITNLSTSPTDWRHVQGNWGTADPNVLMTSIGNDKHEKTIHINSFYNVPSNETVLSLAFVFRNADGSIVGRAVGGGDIFVPISQGGFTAFISSQTARQSVYSQGDTISFTGVSSASATLEFYLDGNLIASQTGATQLDVDLQTANYAPGFHQLVFAADNATQTVVYDTATFITRTGTPIAVLPAYGEEGIKALNDSTMYFQLRAPYKNFVYVMGDFSNWYLKPEYQLNKTPDGQFFWGEITGLDKNTLYAFQYYIDEGLRIADPYCHLVLDPWNDGWIADTTYPNMPDYPTGKTTEIVGTFQIEETPYTWDNSYTYQRPAKEELVVYELLVRDFAGRHNFDAVIDKLDYLQWLGVNTIELMPVNEFEGNESWGYNVSFMFANDKYYGTKNDLKRLIDSCHARGMAVILDMVLNHQFGQSPLVRLYYDGSQTTAQSPWFNQVAKHDFNVGFDFNHESLATKYFSKQVMKYWMEEFKIDGYRFDLSKGFTQKNTLGSVSNWGQYDQGRVNIWSDYANFMWSLDPDFHIILEHFADNSEETVLSNMGLMLWGNMNHEYNEATMGYASNLTGVSHQSRNWNDMHLVGYMESHDEERLMYKNLLFANNNPTYDARVLDTALQRVGLASVFFYTIPGPKMLWQFGELGYDYSINYCPNGTVSPNCRLANKPIRWDYYFNANRKGLYNVVGELNYLRKKYPVFSFDKQHDLLLNTSAKRIKLSDSTMQVVVLGNFDVIPKSINPEFHQTGMWYEHFSQDSLQVTNTTATLTLQPGEYRLYTTVKTEMSSIGLPEAENIDFQGELAVYPTDMASDVFFTFFAPQRGMLSVALFDINGRQIGQPKETVTGGHQTTLVWPTGSLTLPAGIYFYKATNGSNTYTGKLMKR